MVIIAIQNFNTAHPFTAQAQISKVKNSCMIRSVVCTGCIASEQNPCTVLALCALAKLQ